MQHINIQQTVDKTLVPKINLLKKWAKQALNKHQQEAEINIRIVDEKEMADLNFNFRHKQGPTNVLSFPFSMPKHLALEQQFLGDIVICAAVVNREADEQHKTREAHWAHMIVHGIFHLFGYDHETESEAELMEALEINVLHSLGFPNPYQ